MSWVSVALVGAGTAASVGGGIMNRNDALANAQREAAARNASLAQNVGILNTFGQKNEGTFNTNMGAYDPATQAATLSNAQTTRGNNNAANISAADPGSVPIQSDASPATRSDLAKRMMTVHDAATSRAQALGKLGGYGDAWTANQIGNAQANRDIGLTNNMAARRKALVQPESDLAAAAAYQPPSIWGSLLSGAGGIMSAAGGARGFRGGSNSAINSAGDLIENGEIIPG